ncbi:MAG: N-acetylmuramic acid 6-phosphate etherase [Candidatus Kapabacteria bacterium]|nr:N-acetylmuramic acid 6-phosphate etherase [Ignavibacteriota bacterium]MCW5884595.1 N-acetylmuramic acid 6-phosphate etherase [Candidatus Kapabacteria bacterium]
MPASTLFDEIKSLRTEQNNPNSRSIDIASTFEILEIINNEDKLVPLAVEKELPYIETAVNRIVSGFRNGGRLFYVGAGTSGRIGIVDASECPPTFGTDSEMIQGIIAGGTAAIFKAQEGAEDSYEGGREVLIDTSLNSRDIVCGIAASGRTPYVRGALEYAKSLGCFTIFVTTSSREHIESLGLNIDVAICPDVGPEVVEGSTRMKSGTAQKLVLNMLTTASMIKLGKTLGNVMVDLQLTNEKLKERAKRIIMRICEVDYDTAEYYLMISNGHVKSALVMILGSVDYEKSIDLLASTGGFVRQAIEIAKKLNSDSK